jgi:ABC-type transport system involved in multi-copper enzyme maturation permease subunit
MKALLLKDWYLLRKRWGILFGIVLLFSVLAGAQATMLYTLMSTMMLLMISLNTLAYDQHDGWDAYVCALPVSRAQLVLSKYLLAFLCIMISVVLVLISTLVLGDRSAESLIGNASVQISFGFIFVACNFPLILKFGFEKSRVYYLVVAGVLIGLTSLVSQSELASPTFPALPFLVPLFALLVVLGSLRLSIFLVKNKEFSET